METQTIIQERKLIPPKWVSIHYVVIKRNLENDMRDNPNDFDEYLQNAIAIYFVQDLKGSLAAFDNAVIMNPGKAEYYYYRSLLKFAMDDYPGVVKDCSLALKIKPAFEKAILRRGVAEYQCGLFTKALDDLDWSIALNPQCGQAWFVRGIIKITMGNKKTGVSDVFKGQSLGYRDGCVLYSGEWE
jgi:tetratricopeptide (TPR) repeat protein